MAPPTIAPPIRPAATPAATPRWALAGVEASAPASVATARKAEIVFFISGLSWRWAPERERLVKVYSDTELQKRLSRQKAHNRQLGVNVSKQLMQKKVFSCRKSAPETDSSGALESR